MNKRKLVRIGGIAALGLVALVVVSSFVRDGSGESAVQTGSTTEVGYDRDAGSDAVMQTIDKALGREPQVAPQPPKTGAGVPPMPASAPPIAGEYGRTDSTLAKRLDVESATSPADANALSADRKIVQTASMSLQVKQVGASFEEVSRIATGAGGFVASSKFALQGEDQVASMTVRVPAERYQEVLSDIRGLGVKVDTEASNASDVTEEFSDLEARQRNLEATETRLLELMGRATNVNEILQVQDRLNGVRGEIEQVKGRISLLNKLTNLATITVHLRPVVAGAGGGTNGGFDFGAEVSKAWDESLEFLGDVAGAVISVVVFVWWVPLVAVPAWFVTSRVLRSRPRPVDAMD